jgi:K+-transporting ATPase ATPase C chain
MPQLRPALVTFTVLAVTTGIAYPLLITGVGKLFFPRQAEGSLIRRNGDVVGSELIGQSMEDPHYFWGRLSATPGSPTNASSSGGSNFAPSNPELVKAAERRMAALKAMNPGISGPVPVDLVTASGSGLDPHISPAAAEYQIPRVAMLRNLDPRTLRAIVQKHTQQRFLGIIGEPCVNVLAVNLDLDALTGAPN